MAPVRGGGCRLARGCGGVGGVMGLCFHPASAFECDVAGCLGVGFMLIVPLQHGAGVCSVTLTSQWHVHNAYAAFVLHMPTPLCGTHAHAHAVVHVHVHMHTPHATLFNTCHALCQTTPLRPGDALAHPLCQGPPQQGGRRAPFVPLRLQPRL